MNDSRTTPSALCSLTRTLLVILPLLGLFFWLQPPREEPRHPTAAQSQKTVRATPAGKFEEPPRDAPRKPGSIATVPGQYPSLNEALHAARHAITGIDPSDEHSRGASHFTANPKQQLRAWFHHDGIELASGLPTPDAETAWKTTVRFRSFGRDGVRTEPSFDNVTSKGNHVEMQDPTVGITQWFKNQTEGLEQGWSLATPPPGSGPLEIDLAVDGTLQPTSSGSPDTIRFLDAQRQEILTYSHLRAWDARGRDLPAAMEVRGDSLAITVTDHNAAYPITIDPLFQNVEARLVGASPQSSAAFGSSVAISGETALVGAPFASSRSGAETGAAYVFAKRGSYWAQQAILEASDASPRDQFGASVALEGDQAVVGAPGARRTVPATPFSRTITGQAYTYHRNGTRWSESQIIRHPFSIFVCIPFSHPSRFGATIALSGETLLIASPWDSGNPCDRSNLGRVRRYELRDGEWRAVQTLAPSDPSEGEEFGSSLALHGDIALIGSLSFDSDSGRVHVFEKAEGGWEEKARISNPSGMAEDRFGTGLAVNEEGALIGAPFFDEENESDAGRVYAFSSDGSLLGAVTAGVNRFLKAGARFGHSIALAESSVLIGAPGANGAEDTPGTGAAYMFRIDGDLQDWERDPAEAHDTQGETGDEFGATVAFDGRFSIIGTKNAEGGQGAAAIYRYPTNSEWNASERISIPDPIGAGFGRSVVIENETAIIGAPSEDRPSSSSSGSAYIFTRKDALWSLETILTDFSSRFFAGFGTSVDLENDCAVIGAPGSSVASGEVFVFRRTGVEWQEEARLTSAEFDTGDLETRSLGFSVELSGDVLLVGAPNSRTGDTSSVGGAFVFKREGINWTSSAALMPVSLQQFGDMGRAVALDGDWALVGAPGVIIEEPHPTGGFNIFLGEAYLYQQIAGSWTLKQRLRGEGAFAEIMGADPEDNSQFGAAVALKQDTAIVGAPRTDLLDVRDAGVAIVFGREESGRWASQVQLAPLDTATEANFGSSIALHGNLALIGAPQDSVPPRSSNGAAYLYDRKGGIWNDPIRLTSTLDSSPDDQFGTAVALSGNTALVGASKEDFNGNNSGAAYTFLIGDLPEITQQPLSRTIAPERPVSFSVTATGTDPLRYRWRFNGRLLEEDPGISGADQPILQLQSVTVEDSGFYDCVVTNDGGVVTSAAATLTVNPLSQFEQGAPESAPVANGFLIVRLGPPDIGAGWRFAGEGAWRQPERPVTGLPNGDRLIEFRRVPGYSNPAPELVTISGAGLIIERSYTTAVVDGGGSILATLHPGDLAAKEDEVNRAQWRLREPDRLHNPWQNSGDSLSDLTPGLYEVEYKFVPGYVTPPVIQVVVRDGEAASLETTYNPVGSGEAPALIPFETIQDSLDFPYRWVGQIQSEAGSATGFVVKERVVATAGHVVFDDRTLTFTEGLQWLFQRDRTVYETRPQLPVLPRTINLLTGYGEARRDYRDGDDDIPGNGDDRDPGGSDPASQELDVAALWFNEPAGRGGFGGFLASDQVPDEFGAGGNKWLRSTASKILVGYPVDTVAAERAGRLHASPTTEELLAPAGSPHTYTADSIQGGGGFSGGPLCVQFESSRYYPAAVYLGGTGQAIFRAIDGRVVELFNRAEIESFGGDNNVGGGISLADPIVLGVLTVGALTVHLEPEAARNAGAAWRFSTESAFTRQSGHTRGSLTPGEIKTVQFKPVPGFLPPLQHEITIVGGRELILTFTYAEPLTLEQWRVSHFGTREDTGDAADEADPDRDNCSNVKEFLAGTNPNSSADTWRIQATVRTAEGFSVTAPGKTGRIYELQRSESMAGGSWASITTSALLDSDGLVTLTDPVPAAGGAFYRIVVSLP